jgi:photosystem II stability/assembly factor-like uncharacterized protein
MNFKTIVLFSLLLILVNSQSFSQAWHDVKNENPKKAIESFKAAKELDFDTKGIGNKAFARWVYKWDGKLDEIGNLPPAGYAMNTYNEYLRENPPSRQRSSVKNWKSRGPAINVINSNFNAMGRVNSFALDPKNKEIMYVGSAGGGLWKSENAGKNWTPLTDFQGALGVSGIAIHPTQTNMIYIATGDGDANDNYSVGVLKSENGGASWQKTGLDWSQVNNRVLRKIIFDPKDPNIIYTVGSVGIHRSLDAGTTFLLVRSGNFFDIEHVQVEGQTIYYAANGTTIFKSSDNGGTWDAVYANQGIRRIALGISPSNPTTIYGVLANSSDSSFGGLAKSTDGGLNWNIVSFTPNILNSSFTGAGTGGQGWYDLTIAIHPKNADIINIGGVNNWQSTDGGLTWKLKAHWISGPVVTHADKHYMEYDDDVLYEGNDGGMIFQKDSLSRWTDLSPGLVISQLYRLGVSQQNNALITGLQDNGTRRQSNSGVWFPAIGGDGMECHISLEDPTILYGAVQYGALQRSTNGGSSWSSIKPSQVGTANGAWITPYQINSQEPNKIISAYTRVYESADRGTSWTEISPAFGTENLTDLAYSPSNPEVIYTTNGSVVRTTKDGGKTWAAVGSPGTSITRIIVHPKDPNRLFATRSSYRENEKVYQSINGGITWTNISNNSLPNLPANCVTYYNNGKNGLFVGMDIGVYYRDDSTTSWTLVSEGIPNVEIRDIDIAAGVKKLVVATYGRGVWEADIDAPLPLCTNTGTAKVINVSESGMTIVFPKGSGSYSGYQWAIGDTTKPRATEILFTNKDTLTITSLINDIDHYIHYRTKCNAIEFTEQKLLGPIKLNKCAPTTILALGNKLTASKPYGYFQWLRCVEGTNYETITNANGREYTAPGAGSYALAYSDGACADTVKCIAVMPTNDSEFSLSKAVTVYPNPTSNYVWIKSEDTDIKKVVIMDVFGKTLISEMFSDGMQIDLSEFSAGIYFIKTQSSSRLISSDKIVKW